MNVLSGIASIVTFAGWPSCTFGMSVSSTSSSAWMTDMSAIVSSTVPALFIVPITAFSPSSMLRRVTMPSIGESMRTWLRSYRALSRSAAFCLMRVACIVISACRVSTSRSRSRTSFSARSSASRVVSWSFQRSCCRL